MKKKELRRQHEAALKEIRELRAHGSDTWLEALNRVRELKTQLSNLEERLNQLRNNVVTQCKLIQRCWEVVGSTGAGIHSLDKVIKMKMGELESLKIEVKRQTNLATEQRYQNELAQVVIQAAYVWRLDLVKKMVASFTEGERCLARALDAYEDKKLLINPEPDAVVMWRNKATEFEADVMNERTQDRRVRKILTDEIGVGVAENTEVVAVRAVETIRALRRESSHEVGL